MNHQLPWWTLLPAVLIAAIVAWTVRPVLSPTEQTIDIEFPNGKVRISSSAPVPNDTVFAQIFSTDFGREGALGVLREKHRVYRFDDERLAETLRTQLCDSIPEEPLADRLNRAQACADKPLASRLRALAKAHKAPFHYVGESVALGVQADEAYRPDRGEVNVCRNGQFVGERLQVIDPVSLREIEVRAAGIYDCTLPLHPKLQLHPDDARDLFGRALDKYEKAIVMVL